VLLLSKQVEIFFLQSIVYISKTYPFVDTPSEHRSLQCHSKQMKYEHQSRSHLILSFVDIAAEHFYFQSIAKETKKEDQILSQLAVSYQYPNALTLKTPGVVAGPEMNSLGKSV
jgi:hypothetical protein